MTNRPMSRARLKALPVTKLIPNMLTLMSLCAGVTAIRFALGGDFQAAVVAIAIAGLFDVLDGGMARLLKAHSSFGAELDSLADMVSFGVAPAMVLFMWRMADMGSLGWALVLLLSVCCALRLARFNTLEPSPDLPKAAGRYFVGVPAPAAAGLVMLPLMFSFEFDNAIFTNLALNATVIIFVSFLMIGRLPTYSLKGIVLPHRFVLPVMVLAGLMAGFLVTSPWLTLGAIGLAYLVSLPLSYRSYQRMLRIAERNGATSLTPTP